MIVLFHAICFILSELSTPVWQNEVRQITYQFVEAMRDAEKNNSNWENWYMNGVTSLIAWAPPGPARSFALLFFVCGLAGALGNFLRMPYTDGNHIPPLLRNFGMGLAFFLLSFVDSCANHITLLHTSFRRFLFDLTLTTRSCFFRAPCFLYNLGCTYFQLTLFSSSSIGVYQISAFGC